MTTIFIVYYNNRQNLKQRKHGAVNNILIKRQTKINDISSLGPNIYIIYNSTTFNVWQEQTFLNSMIFHKSDDPWEPCITPANATSIYVNLAIHFTDRIWKQWIFILFGEACGTKIILALIFTFLIF